MMKGIFVKGANNNYYFVVENRKLIKFTYDKKIVPNKSALVKKPNLPFVNCEVVDDVSDDRPLYTFMIFHHGIMKDTELEKLEKKGLYDRKTGMYDKKLGLMTKSGVLSMVKQYTPKMEDTDEIVVYKATENPNDFEIKYVHAFKKMDGRMEKIDF